MTNMTSHHFLFKNSATKKLIGDTVRYIFIHHLFINGWYGCFSTVILLVFGGVYISGVASFPPSHDGCEAVDSCVPQCVAAIHFPNLTDLGGLLALYCAAVFFLFGVCVCVCVLAGGFKYCLFHPYLEKIHNLTNIFQMGWNHQLGNQT